MLGFITPTRLFVFYNNTIPYGSNIGYGDKSNVSLNLRIIIDRFFRTYQSVV